MKELLIPAGNMECFKVAVHSGADAIYLAGLRFGARAYAGNFTDEELIEAIKYAHLYGVKVNVTVNTLIYESEIDDAINYLEFLYKNGVDAVIIQDIGLIYVAKKKFPNLEIHASTQVHNTNQNELNLLEDLGVKRAVFARELSVDEIDSITTSLEKEAFIHGALCISYSGECLFSSIILNRSGNRGECAQMCRLPYKLESDGKIIKTNGKFLLSPKDLNTSLSLKKVLDSSIYSLKIEGRMKSPEYVYIITSLYRHAIDSYIETGKVSIDDKELEKLKKIFNRGFTKGFIFNEENNNFTNQKRPNHMGVEIGRVISYNNCVAKIKLDDNLSINDGIRILGKDDTGMIVTSMMKNGSRVKEAFKGDIVSIRIDDKVAIDSMVLKTKDTILIDEIYSKITSKSRKVDIDMSFKANIDGMSLTIRHNDIEVISYGAKPDKAINREVTYDDIKTKLLKLGDTPYKVDKLDINLEPGLFINIKDINELRRDAINKLNEKRLEVIPYIEKEYTIDIPDFKCEKNVNYKVGSISIFNKLKDYHNIYVDDINLYEKIPNSIYLLPRVNRIYEDLERVEVSELGGLNKYKNVGVGPFLNAVNSYTVAFLHSIGANMVTLSYEITEDKVERLIDIYHKRYNKHPNIEVIVYGSIEAMISKYNLLKYFKLDENNIYYLVSKFKDKYPVKIKDNKMLIYYDRKRCDDYNYFDVGVNNIRIDLDEEKDLLMLKH